LVEEICRRVGRPDRAEVVLGWVEQRMASYDWPGNVRELSSVVSVAATMASEPGTIDDVLMLVRDESLADRRRAATAFGEAKRGAIALFERDYFTGLARRCKGNVSEMARQSGMERHHVRAYLRKYEIDKNAGN
jgi:DNA-binding NtrC family response regulator